MVLHDRIVELSCVDVVNVVDGRVAETVHAVGIPYVVWVHQLHAKGMVVSFVATARISLDGEAKFPACDREADFTGSVGPEDGFNH